MNEWEVGRKKQETASPALGELVMAKAAAWAVCSHYFEYHVGKAGPLPEILRKQIYPNILLGPLHAGEFFQNAHTSHLNSCLKSQSSHLGQEGPPATFCGSAARP